MKNIAIFLLLIAVYISPIFAGLYPEEYNAATIFYIGYWVIQLVVCIVPVGGIGVLRNKGEWIDILPFSLIELIWSIPSMFSPAWKAHLVILGVGLSIQLLTFLTWVARAYILKK